MLSQFLKLIFMWKVVSGNTISLNTSTISGSYHHPVPSSALGEGMIKHPILYRTESHSLYIVHFWVYELINCYQLQEETSLTWVEWCNSLWVQECIIRYYFIAMFIYQNMNNRFSPGTQSLLTLKFWHSSYKIWLLSHWESLQFNQSTC